MSDVSTSLAVFKALLALRDPHTGRIPLGLRPLKTSGTVQDDPFDEWVGNLLRDRLKETFEVTHSGPLTTPDLIVRHRLNREIIGLEVKKIEEQKTGKDSRGLTLDYNSCIPCGRMQVKIGQIVSTIRTYYMFALISYDKSSLVSLAVVDGDFLNYDFDLHLKAKLLNTSEYGQGSYGEGSTRSRAMYNYPNPMNTQLEVFHQKYALVVKESLAYQMDASDLVHTATIHRVDIAGETHVYHKYEDTAADPAHPELIADIFAKCKARKPKKRSAYMTGISEAPAPYSPSGN